MMKSESLKGGGSMKKNFLVYGSYLGILALIVVITEILGISTKIGLWIALAVAALYAVFWPRW